MDFYDETDEYWQIQLVFRDLFTLREQCAELMDISKDVLIPNESILILSRQQPRTSDQLHKVIEKFSVDGNVKELGALIVKTIANSLEQFPHEKADLLAASSRKGSKKVGSDAKGREKIKEEKRAMQVNRVKYDNCKVLDRNGDLSFICDEKKARWYLKEGHAVKISDKPLIV